MQQAAERNLKKTATVIKETTQAGPAGYSDAALAAEIERRLVSAAWTLRRLPDKERGFLRLRNSVWPEGAPEPGDYPGEDIGYFASRKRGRISAPEIDAMQPALDLLTLLPDVQDRKILFWAAWHQNGEPQSRIPWVKVRRSLDSNASRWTLKRRYAAGLKWLAALVNLQR